MPYQIELKLVKCPFNPQHVFTQDRLQTHVIKCAQNYPNHFICPFYNLHRFLDEDERNAHVFLCDKKMTSQPWIYEKKEQQGKFTPTVTQLDIPDRDKDDEDWESEYNNRN